MSIEAINAVSKMDIQPSGRKFVALALANFADENWTCYPSTKRIAEWTGQGEKTVRRHLEDLEYEGYLIRERNRRDDGTLGVYRFYIQRSYWPAANLATGQNVRSPAAKMATHNHQDKPSVINNSARAEKSPSPKQELETVLDTERAKAVVAHRKAIRKPLTEHAAKLLARKFAACPDPNAAADAMISNGWQGFDPSWLDKPPARAGPLPLPQRRRSAGDIMREIWEQENGNESAEIYPGDVVRLPADAGR